MASKPGGILHLQSFFGRSLNVTNRGGIIGFLRGFFLLAGRIKKK